MAGLPRGAGSITGMGLLVTLIGVWAFGAPMVRHTSSVQPSGAQRVLFGATVAPTYAILDRGIEHIVGRLRFNATGRDSVMLASLLPELAQVPAIGLGQQLDPEVVMASRPDAVVVWTSQSAALRRVGVPGLVELGLGGRSSTETGLAIWATLGQVAGARSRAEALTARYLAYRQSLQQQRSAAGEGRAPRVLLLVGGQGRGYWLGGSRHLLNERFEAAGGQVIQRTQARNVTSSANGASNLEQILLLDPDVVFLETSGTGDMMVPADLYAKPEWRAVRAVRERRVYKMPDVPGFATPLEDPIRLQWLFEILHPNAGPSTSRQQIRETVRAVFDRDIQEADVDRILIVSDNQPSLGYPRFEQPKGLP